MFLVSAFVFYPASAQTNPNTHIERIIRGAFSDIPDMITIAKCESGFRQFNNDGSVLRGGGTGRYLGIFQIDENIHTQKALSMGFDIKTVEGNIGYARQLHSASGTNPWKGCIGSPATPSPMPATSVQTPNTATHISGELTANLNVGMANPQVKLLQQILNRLGYTVSTSGPGSAGSETDYFGSLTREAVKRFQCSKNITCTGNESSTGYGRVGPMTRAALNQASQ